MKKKIVASVAALLLAATVLPVNKLAEVFPNTAGAFYITASADNFDTSDMHVVYAYNESFPTQSEVQVYSKYTDYTVSSLTIGLSDSQYNEIKNNIPAGTISDYKIAYMGNWNTANDTPDSMSSFAALAKVTFKNENFNKVGDNAFVGCPKLTTIDLGSNIKYIGDSAFAGCPLFVGGPDNHLNISNILEIGNNAFNGGSFTEVLFSNDITSIGESAFAGCAKLGDVTIPSSVKYLRAGAFQSCAALEKILFAKDPQLVILGGGAFSDCPKLSSITVEGGGSENTIPADKLGVYGEGIFEGDTSLQSFLWPAQSTWVPERTFNGCTKLNKVYFGDKDGKTSIVKWIAPMAFQNCVKLTDIALPESTVSILSCSFAGCTSLKTLVVSDKLKNIGGHIEKEPVPEEIYGPNVYYPSVGQSLNQDIYYGDKLEHLDGSTFAGCEQLSIYPRSKMDDAAANPNKYKNKIDLPSTVEAIPVSCFANCYNITDVNIPNVESIGREAFVECYALKSVKIPDYTVAAPSQGYTFINDGTFRNCRSLKDVEIPANLRYIRSEAFKGCTDLETMTPTGSSKINKTIQIPDTTSAIMASAFSDCESFNYLNFGSDSELGALGDSAFNNCSSLIGSNTGSSSNNTISVPKGIVYIEPNLFANCRSLDKITFLGNISTIGATAFNNCENLEQIIMNDTIETVDGGAFANCRKLKQMPQTLEGQPALINLKVINASTFENCESLTSAFISKNITQINANAFVNCTSLKNVQWESGSQLKGIGESAFAGDVALTLFSDKTSGDLSTFPETLENIGSASFNGSGILNVKIGKPSSGELMFIDANAFAGCPELTKMDLSESNMNNIPAYMCTDCPKLKTVVLPKGSITTINTNAFANCTVLHTFGDSDTPEGEYVFPEGLNANGEAAFANNLCMQKVTFPSSMSIIDLTMFNIYVDENEVKEKGYTPIEEIVVSPGNESYSSSNGILFNKDKTELLVYPLHKKGESFTIPDGVEKISVSGMAANKYLKDIKINKELQEIQSRAFNDVHNLQTVDFGNNTTVNIAGDAFGGNDGIVTLYGASGSTAESFAENNPYAVVFVDNAKAAASIKLLNEVGGVINSDTFKISAMKSGYQFGVVQKDKSGATSQDSLKWSVDKEDVATINNEGWLSISKKGAVMLTVQNAAGTASTTVRVEIVDGDVYDYKRGDVDLSGKIDIEDAVQVIAHINGVRALTGASEAAADVDGNSKIDIEDAVAIISHVNGIKALT